MSTSRFEQPSEDLKFETKKGELIISKDSYLIIKTENRENNLMITKRGIQKIEDFFEINPKAPQIQQQWLGVNNFNFTIVIELESPYGNSYGCASANPLNLTNQISKAYPVELGVKRARATASLELLRKNYIGKEEMALLFSSYDEFKSENSINNPDSPKVEIKNEVKNNEDIKPISNKKQVAKDNEVKIENAVNNVEQVEKEIAKIKDNSNNVEVEKEVKKEVKKEVEKETSTEVVKETENQTLRESDVDVKFAERFPTIKYKDTTNLIELFNTDKPYLKKLATSPNKKRAIANEFLEVLKISVDSLPSE